MLREPEPNPRIPPEMRMDETKWREIRPLLEEMWQGIVAAGKSAKKFVRLVLEHLSPEGRPYLERFVRENFGQVHLESFDRSKPLKKVPYEESGGYLLGKAMQQPPKKWQKIPY